MKEPYNDSIVVNAKHLEALIGAAKEASEAMTDSVSLDLAVGNDGHEDVAALNDSLDRLYDALSPFTSFPSSNET